MTESNPPPAPKSEPLSDEELEQVQGGNKGRSNWTNPPSNSADAVGAQPGDWPGVHNPNN